MRGPLQDNLVESPLPPAPTSWETRHGLVRGYRYRITESFVDADGDVHGADEEWEFCCGMFDKFSDEIQICVRLIDGSGWQVPLSWKSDEQSGVIENIGSYLRRV